VRAALGLLATHARALVDAEAATVFLTDASGSTFAPAAESLSDSERAAQLQRRDAPERSVSRGLVGWVIASGEAAFVPDARRDPRTLSQRSSQTAEAVIAVPLRLADRVIGCLRLSVTGRQRFTESDLGLAQLVADEAALALAGAEQAERARAAARSAGGRAATARMAEPVAALLQATDAEEVDTRDADQLRRQLETAHAAGERLCDAMHQINAGIDCRARGPFAAAEVAETP
jgi:GAF domain-containing protein